MKQIEIKREVTREQELKAEGYQIFLINKTKYAIFFEDCIPVEEIAKPETHLTREVIGSVYKHEEGEWRKITDQTLIEKLQSAIEIRRNHLIRTIKTREARNKE